MSVTRNFFSFLFFYSQFAASRWWSLASTFLVYLEYLALRTGGVGFGIPFDGCIRLILHILFPHFPTIWVFGLIFICCHITIDMERILTG